MIPEHWETRESKIAEVLREHFPDCDAPTIHTCSRSIGDSYSAATTLQTIERADKPPEKDIEALSGAWQHIKDALAKLEGLGLHGGQALQEPIFEYIQRNTVLRHIGRPSITETLGITCDALFEMTEILDRARNGVPKDAKSWRGSIDKNYTDNRKGGRPPETQAFFTAAACRDVYEHIKGVRATVSSRPSAHARFEKYGPFLELVTDIFAALSIDGKPLTAAEAVVQKPKK